MFLDYDLPENHVNKRESLPTEVKQTLLESTRSEWRSHPRFGGKANFFMTIHRDLLDGAAQLSRGIEQLMDVPVSEISEAVARMNLLPFSNNLIGFAHHHHHEVEDHSYIPAAWLAAPPFSATVSTFFKDLL